MKYINLETAVGLYEFFHSTTFTGVNLTGETINYKLFVYDCDKFINAIRTIENKVFFESSDKTKITVDCGDKTCAETLRNQIKEAKAHLDTNGTDTPLLSCSCKNSNLILSVPSGMDLFHFDCDGGKIRIGYNDSRFHSNQVFALYCIVDNDGKNDHYCYIGQSKGNEYRSVCDRIREHLTQDSYSRVLDLKNASRVEVRCYQNQMLLNLAESAFCVFLNSENNILMNDKTQKTIPHSSKWLDTYFLPPVKQWTMSINNALGNTLGISA